MRENGKCCRSDILVQSEVEEKRLVLGSDGNVYSVWKWSMACQCQFTYQKYCVLEQADPARQSQAKKKVRGIGT